MATKHMKRCSTLYVCREIQIKTARYHYTPIRMTPTTPNAGEDVEQRTQAQTPQKVTVFGDRVFTEETKVK